MKMKVIFITFFSLFTMSAFGAAAGADIKSRSEGKPARKNVNDVNTYLPPIQLFLDGKATNPMIDKRLDLITKSLDVAEGFKKFFSDRKFETSKTGTTTIDSERLYNIFGEAERLAKLYELRIMDVFGYLTALNEYSTDVQSALRKLQEENQQLKAELAKTKQAAKPVSAAASAAAAPAKSVGQDEPDSDQPGASR